SFSSEQIRNTQSLSLADVLTYDPTVRFTQPRGGNEQGFQLRGLPVFATDIGFNGLFGLTSLGRASVESAERIEVLRGPSTSIVGVPLNQSVSGSINIIPKRASTSSPNEVSLAYISDSTLSGLIDFGTRFGPRDEYGVQITSRIVDGDTSVDSLNEERIFLSSALDYSIQNFSVALDLIYEQRRTDRSLSATSVAPGVDFPSKPNLDVNPAQPWEFFEDDSFMVAFDINYTPIEAIEIFAAAGWKDYEQSRVRVTRVIENANGDFTSNSLDTQLFPEDVFSWRAGSRTTFSTGPINHNFTIAANGLTRDFSFVGGNVPIQLESSILSPVIIAEPEIPGILFSVDPIQNPDSFILNRKNENFGITIVDSVKLFDDRLEILGGARYQYIKIGDRYDEDIWSPIISTIISITDELSFYATYNEGLRSGPSAPTTGVANPGEVFPPSSTESVETGLKFDIGQIGGSVSIFQIERPTTNINEATNQFEVIGGDTYQGLEILIFGEPLEGLNLLSGLTFLDSEIVSPDNPELTGNVAPASSDILLSFTAEYEIPALKGLAVRGTATHTGRQFINVQNTQKIDSSTRLDIGARYALTTGDYPITLRGDIQNVTGIDYWASAGEGPGEVIRGEPRTFLFSASIPF
ncbi:MAG: TonB-dependent receptor, partial [Bacteroidota bacterium]